MLRPWQKITINGNVLPFLTKGVVVTSRNNFTDTAMLEMPNRITTRGERISDKIPLGGNIKIEIGYFPYIHTIFEGYISDVIPEKLCVIRAENEAYIYKRKSIGRDVILKNTSTAELINELAEGTDLSFITGSNNIGDWKVSKTSTIVDVMAELQDKFKMYTYFRNSVLVVGADADNYEFKEVKAKFEQGNIPMGMSSFNFKDSAADKVVSKVSSIGRDGSINEMFAYYDGVPQRVVFAKVAPTSGTVSEYSIGGQSKLTDDDLKNLAQRRLEAISFTGVDGNITIYGSIEGRMATHGDNCLVESLDIPEKNGLYKIVENELSFGVGVGIKQKLGIGTRIDE